VPREAQRPPEIIGLLVPGLIIRDLGGCQCFFSDHFTSRPMGSAMMGATSAGMFGVTDTLGNHAAQ
jgi:hypothetical protein